MKLKTVIDSEFVYNLVKEVGHVKAYGPVKDILPIVLFEAMALGPAALPRISVRVVKLRLDDGQDYKLKYEHKIHCIVLVKMFGNTNGPIVAHFNNSSSREDVWLALRPARLALTA